MSTRRWRGCGRGAFALQLAGTGVFGGDRPRNLWVGVERDAESHRAARQDRAGADPRRAAARAAQIRAARDPGAAADPPLDKLGEFLAAHARFRAEPLPVEAFSLIASYPTKAGSVYEDQADYPLHN